MSDGAGSDYYTAADQQIREVHDALLDLKYLPFDPDHDRSRFGLGRSSSTRVPPHLAARPVVPDGRRRRRAAPSTPIPSSTTFAQMIDYKRPRSDAVIDENDDPEIAWQRWLQAWKPSSPRAGVRQSRTRPAHLDQYLDEIHGRRTSRPDLVPIDDTPSRSPVATADAQTETDAERRRRARASMTDPAPAVVDVATSPTRTVSRSPSIDEEIVIRSNDDCMDWESGSSQMHGSVSINDAVILSESTRLNGWRRSRSLSDPSDDLILAMILQMFAAALSRSSDESPPAVTVSEPVIADPDLVQVQLEVVDRHRDLPHVRLSIRDAHAPVPWVVYGADPVPVAVAAAPVQDTGTDPIIDDVIGDVSTPLSPRYRSCGRRSLVGTDRLRLSPARSLDAVEVVRVAGQRDGAVSDAARSLERYVETDLDATDHAEAFLIEPMIDDLIHDLIEILIIVTASPDHQTDVMVAVRVLGAPSGVCLGPIARRPMLVAPSPPSPNAADIDQAAIAGDCPDRLTEPETPSSGCGRDDDEDGDAHPHLGSSPRSYEIAYRGGWVSDRSDTTSSGSADDSDEDDDVLGPISAIPLSSSGEFALSHDPFSDGEIIYPCLRDLLSETGHLHLSSTHALDWSSSDDDSKSEG